LKILLIDDIQKIFENIKKGFVFKKIIENIAIFNAYILKK
jgi:hypothetical protein